MATSHKLELRGVMMKAFPLFAVVGFFTVMGIAAPRLSSDEKSLLYVVIAGGAVLLIAMLAGIIMELRSPPPEREWAPWLLYPAISYAAGLGAGIYFALT